MSEREFDVIVLGATGFTGTQVCLHLARSIQNGNWSGISWAIAGRNQERMEEKVISRLRSEGLAVPTGVICADISDEETLQNALGRARLCLNCTGPYRFLGEPVVHACVDVGYMRKHIYGYVPYIRTDYIDLCGEPEFMASMVLKYHEKALAKQVLIMHACAFDSIPADLGCLFTARQFKAPGVCSSVSSYLTLKTGPAGFVGHATTFEAAVHGFGSAKNLRSIRKKVQEKFPPAEVPRVGPRPGNREGPFFEEHEGVRSYSFKFPGADASVVRWTQNDLASRGGGTGLCPHYSAFFTVGGWWGASMMTLYGGLFQMLARGDWGRGMLLKYPETFTKGLFSHTGPSQEQMEQTSFEMLFLAKGYSPEAGPSTTDAESGATAQPPGIPDVTVVTKVQGPEPGERGKQKTKEKASKNKPTK